MRAPGQVLSGSALQAVATVAVKGGIATAAAAPSKQILGGPGGPLAGLCFPLSFFRGNMGNRGNALYPCGFRCCPVPGNAGNRGNAKPGIERKISPPASIERQGTAHEGLPSSSLAGSMW